MRILKRCRSTHVIIIVVVVMMRLLVFSGLSQRCLVDRGNGVLSVEMMETLFRKIEGWEVLGSPGMPLLGRYRIRCETRTVRTGSHVSPRFIPKRTTFMGRNWSYRWWNQGRRQCLYFCRGGCGCRGGILASCPSHGWFCCVFGFLVMGVSRRDGELS